MTAAPGPRGPAEWIERAGQRLARLSLACGAAMLVLVLALTCADVVGRYLLGAPVNGKTEITRFLMAGLIAFALPVVTLTDNHIAVDIFDPRFSSRGKRIRDFAIDVLAAIATLTLAWWVAFRAHRLMEYGYASDFLRVPLYPIAYFVALMVALTGLALGVRIALVLWYAWLGKAYR
jgi:TRAP-type C4-dicarboxylate transport system permease small subunit